MTAQEFSSKVQALRKTFGTEIPKREIFALAKTYLAMPVPEVVVLLKNTDLDCRVGAVSILDWKARAKKTTLQEKEQIYHAYLNNHEWIDHWGLVDRAAPYVVGGYLFDKDRSPLYELAKSSHPMERRTAIVSTYYFIRLKEIDDTFKLAEILVHDPDEYVQLAVGSWIREAGKQDMERLKKFLDQYAASMPRTILRYAVEKLDEPTKQKYLQQ